MSNHHDELEELLGAYALDALDDDERRKVERMLESNPRARAEVQQHRETASMLAFSGSTAPDAVVPSVATTVPTSPRVRRATSARVSMRALESQAIVSKGSASTRLMRWCA